jgi:hypothetical protein
MPGPLNRKTLGAIFGGLKSTKQKTNQALGPGNQLTNNPLERTFPFSSEINKTAVPPGGNLLGDAPAPARTQTNRPVIDGDAALADHKAGRPFQPGEPTPPMPRNFDAGEVRPGEFAEMGARQAEIKDFIKTATFKEQMKRLGMEQSFGVKTAGSRKRPGTTITKGGVPVATIKKIPVGGKKLGGPPIQYQLETFEGKFVQAQGAFNSVREAQQAYFLQYLTTGPGSGIPIK